MYTKTGTMLLWFAGSYLFLVFLSGAWWQTVLGAASLAFAIAGVGFCVQHDANHGAYSKSRVVNRILERTLDLLGASSYLCRWKHNVFHHTYTNVLGADHDVQLAPFARLAPPQSHRRWHRFQHLYMWVAYGFTVFHMHFVEDFANVVTGRVGRHSFPRPRGIRLFEVFANKIVLLGWALVVPLLFHSWWIVLVVYLSVGFAVGLILALVFQVAHCHDNAPFSCADTDRRQVDEEWAVHQVKATADFSPTSWLATWYLGGLNFQIEHHLFPKICHVHYSHLAPLVRQTCEEFEVPYTCYPSFAAAVASHARLLHRLSRADQRVVSHPFDAVQPST